MEYEDVFDRELRQHRELIKEAKTMEEQDRILIQCDTISYMMEMCRASAMRKRDLLPYLGFYREGDQEDWKKKYEQLEKNFKILEWSYNSCLEELLKLKQSNET